MLLSEQHDAELGGRRIDYSSLTQPDSNDGDGDGDAAGDDRDTHQQEDEQ